MKRLVVVLFAFFFVACGLLPEEPTPGIYDVTTTAVSLVPSPAGTTCGTLNTTPHRAVFEVVKESGEWVMYGCDAAGVRQVKFATYDRGSQDFRAHGCVAIWCEDITVSLKFSTADGKTTVEGESVVVLTAPGYPGSCTETSDVFGIKR